MGGPRQAFLDNIADQEGAEVGVIVVAENEDICEEALRALDVDWEVLPHVVDLRKGREPNAPVIRPIPPCIKGGGGGGFRTGGGSDNPPKKGNVSYSNVSDGDVEAGFREADHIIEYDVNTAAFAGHIPNPTGSVAWWFDDANYGEGKRTCTLKVFLPGLKIRLQTCTIYPRKRFFGKACFWEADIAIGEIAKRS